MSWWDDDNDILGDEPADRIKGAWRTLIARRRARGASAPTLGEALEAFVDAMREAVPESPFDTLEVVFDDGHRLSYSGEEGGEAGADDLRELLLPALARIVVAYRNRFDRPPRVRELVKTLDFIVTVDPSAYFADVAASALLRLEAR
jgi:hypothetical protein